MTQHPTPSTSSSESPRDHHVCPWWVAYLLTSPIRKLGEDPETILRPLVEPGMTAVDIGSARGFFSLPLARMVGERGAVYCLDVQDRLLRSLDRRARNKGLEGIIHTRLCTQEDLGLGDLRSLVDLILAAHVIHETAYPQRVLRQCFESLKPGGSMVIIEPTGHVSAEEFDRTRDLARTAGFSESGLTRGRRSRRIVLRRLPEPC